MSKMIDLWQALSPSGVFLSSKIHQNSFSARALPRTTLGSLYDTSQTPIPFPLDAFGVLTLESISAPRLLAPLTQIYDYAYESGPRLV